MQYFLNVYITQGQSFSEGATFADREAACDDINDTIAEYLETLWRKEDGSLEVLDLSSQAGALERHDRAELKSTRQHYRFPQGTMVYKPRRYR